MIKLINIPQAIFCITISCMLFISCQGDDGFADFDAGGSKTEALAGEWFVREYSLTGEVLSDYSKISTFNTAEDNESDIWLQDIDLLSYQIMVVGDVTNLNFNVNNSENILDDTGMEQITISNGRILRDAGFAIETRTVVDSIVFNYSSSSSATPLLIAGHRRTGFLEDEL